MVKKKGDENKDLTRIEDLSEFLHQEDSDLDSRFDTFSSNSSNEPTSEAIDLNILEEAQSLPDFPEIYEIPDAEEADEETDQDENSEDQEITYDKTSFGENPFGPSDSDVLDELEDVSFTNEVEGNNLESNFDELEEQTTDDIEKELAETNYSHAANDIASAPHEYVNTAEKFEDVKEFAQNFSYGKTTQGGGNPPYTVIARNIKYQEDAESILDILSEFGLINDQNKKDTEKAIEFGALIIPQISEYTAIIIAHRLRRFDLDLQIGLSDEVHPSRSGTDNPRGLVKKENLKQNKSEHLRLTDLDISINDIIMSTTSAIPGYFVKNYVGVETVFSIVEEAELEKLHYVDRADREQTELFDYSDSEVSTKQIFQAYKKSFDFLYADLTMQLKQKAFVQNANALLGLSFQISPLQFSRSHDRINAYQITCSATLANIGKEDS